MVRRDYKEFQVDGVSAHPDPNDPPDLAVRAHTVAGRTVAHVLPRPSKGITDLF
jgi:hypothetical protein